MKFAVISDIHLLEENREEALRLLDRTIDEIERRGPELVIVLGDLIGGAVTTGIEAPEEDEGLEELKEIRDRFDSLEAEKLYLAGNHEQDVGPEQFSDLFSQENFGIREVGGEKFVFLDSSAPELSGSRGQVSRDQLKFLDETLESLDEAFLVIHHPVHFRDLSHSYFWDVYPERAFCGNKKEINNVLQKHDNVKAVFNAHIHDLDLTEYKGRPHFTNPPFISEDRKEGFNQYFTMVDVSDAGLELEVFVEGEVERSFSI
ncbi:metallophosphoesterase family protein [Candidatus Nanohalovita haloferacivicina]|uniref:metallophosphoesterase family protein n=1 Tax=Candidatus Nanohalovita haloferacivicina TaxID=2978046 RepID=UPI00325FC8EB|nr:3',5'-cyclic AMP phosphodiesterase [Candidatus Nanohalobia archaeon BNXNv]